MEQVKAWLKPQLERLQKWFLDRGWLTAHVPPPSLPPEWEGFELPLGQIGRVLDVSIAGGITDQPGWVDLFVEVRVPNAQYNRIRSQADDMGRWRDCRVRITLEP